MAILGVLLGITMTVLAGAIWFIKGQRDHLRNSDEYFNKRIDETDHRVTLLEKRKALLAEAVTTQPKPSGVAGQKLRTWNEDAAPAEVKHG